MIGREAPTVTQPPQEIKTPEPALMVEGVPLDLTRMFGMDVFSLSHQEKRQLNEIYQWAKNGDEGSMGDILGKIKDIRLKLGAPRNGESELIKIWNWLRLRENINEMRKRQESLEYGTA